MWAHVLRRGSRRQLPRKSLQIRNSEPVLSNVEGSEIRNNFKWRSHNFATFRFLPCSFGVNRERSCYERRTIAADRSGKHRLGVARHAKRFHKSLAFQARNASGCEANESPH